MPLVLFSPAGEKHRVDALPCFLCEQTSKTAFFELKMASAYAGKRKVAPGRCERGGFVLTCCKGDAGEFWEKPLSVTESGYLPPHSISTTKMKTSAGSKVRSY